MKHLKSILSVLLAFMMIFTLVPTAFVNATEPINYLTDMSDATLGSVDFVEQKLKKGINIGNQFDGCVRQEDYTVKTEFDSVEEEMDYWETLWTNTVITEEYVQYLKDCGFQLIRLPVSWYDHIGEKYWTDAHNDVTQYADINRANTIDTNWLNRVQRVVDMIINSGMYCMINIHHDGHNGCTRKKIVLDEAHRESTSEYMHDIWTQVGTHFASYGTHLLYQGFNEPTDSSKSMTANAERTAEATLQMKVFIKTVRDLGGNNAQRFLVCPGYAGLSLPDVAKLVDTAENKLISSLHKYFDGTSNDTYGFSDHISKNNVGIIVDEIGPSGRRPDADNGALAASIRSTVDKVEGLSTCWWDNGQAHEYSLIDRATVTPTNYKALSAYLGKTIDPVTTTGPLTTQEKPYVAVFCTEDVSSESPKIYGKKYFAVVSENKISSIVRKGGKAGNFFYYTFDEDTWVTLYESDDNETFYQLDTRFINEFCYAKWKGSASYIVGSTSLTYLSSTNYEENYEITGAPDKPFTLTIDGNKNYVGQGEKFVFPYNEDTSFIGYTDGEAIYDGGDVIIPTEDCSFTTLYLELDMVKGASMRLTDVSGIRYYTKVNTTQYNALKDTGATLTKGTIIASKANLDGNEVTFETPTTINDKQAYVTVPFETDTWYQDEDFTGIVGSIVGISSENANNQMIGRGYVTITLGDFEKTIYATYADDKVENNTRSIGYIACAITQDEAAYASLAEYKDIIDTYAYLYVDPMDPSANDKF